MLEDKFIVAIAHWNLEMLYADLTSAKQQVYPGKCKKLTTTEQACLRGLLFNALLRAYQEGNYQLLAVLTRRRTVKLVVKQRSCIHYS